MGFTGFAPKPESGVQLQLNPLCFVDNETLIATFITREKAATLAHRDQLNEAFPLRLHAIFMNSKAGKVSITKEWPITRPTGGIIATGGGKFAVLTPAMISLYFQNLELIKDLKLTSEEQSNLWRFHISPSGKSIVAEYHTPEAYYQWIDTNTLITRPISIPTAEFSISDNDVAIYRDPFIKSKGFLSETLIQSTGGPWRTICYVPPGEMGGCGYPEFLDNDVLALWEPHEFALTPKTGDNFLFRAMFHDNEWLGFLDGQLAGSRFYSSSGGERFAVTVWAHKGGNEFLDTSSHGLLKRIVVYDISSRQAVYTLDAEQQKIKDVSGIALSPDGYLMAILVDGVVEVYQLPR